jgi:hypothetical protein
MNEEKEDDIKILAITYIDDFSRMIIVLAEDGCISTKQLGGLMRFMNAFCFDYISGNSIDGWTLARSKEES